MTKFLIHKLVFISLIIFYSSYLNGQTTAKIVETLVAEKMTKKKVCGKYFRYEPLCSRAYKIKNNHHIKYKGGCEGNKDTRKSGYWAIKNDTLIITKLYEKQQKWILVNGCLHNVTSSTNWLVACRQSSLH